MAPDVSLENACFGVCDTFTLSSKKRKLIMTDDDLMMIHDDGCTPEINITMENHHVQSEIHLKMFVFPLSS